MLFGGKKSTNINTVPLTIQTIPTEFYAGANPVIKFKTIEHEVAMSGTNQPALSRQDKKLLDGLTAVGSGKPLHPIHWLAKRGVMLGGLGLMLLLLIGGAVWFYLRNMPAKSVTLSTPKPLSPPPPIEPATVAPVEENITPNVAVIPTTTSNPSNPQEGKLEFPSRLLVDNSDADGDKLTDVEEELYHTDPQMPDTDEDKYQDGHEVYNLYNPAGKEPEKLIAAGLVKDFENPVFGYKIYYPASWAVGNVDPNYRDVLFSTFTGEFVEARVFDKLGDESFIDWFGRQAPEERYDELTNFSSVFKVLGKKRLDDLVYYFEDKQHIYVILYHTTNGSVANYRMVAKMIGRSFRLPLPAPEIPSRIVEEGVSALGNSSSSFATTSSL